MKTHIILRIDGEQKVERYIFKVIGPIGVAFALAALCYALFAILEGKIHWVTKSTSVLIMRTSDPLNFWLFTGFMVIGGIYGLWIAIRVVKEYW